MAKWEYAAIVRDKGIWFLVKPAKERILGEIVKGQFSEKIKDAWQFPARARAFAEEISSYNANKARNKPRRQINDGLPIYLYESSDILELVNLAGADGWEITGGLGLADGRPGYGHDPPKRETKWRMMRREL